MGFEDQFDVSIVNDDKERSTKEAEELVSEFLKN
jgi:hypothetical protein